MTEFFKLSDEAKKVKEKRAVLGPLSLTAGDYKVIMSTPPKILVDNPGKTLAEIMTDEEIGDLLNKMEILLDEMKTLTGIDEEVKNRNIREVDAELAATKHYLHTIGRMPKR